MSRMLPARHGARRLCGLAVAFALGAGGVRAQAPAALHARAEVSVPAFTLPYSGYASPQAKALMAQRLAEPRFDFGTDVALARRHYGAFNDARLAEMRRVFDTRVEHRTLGGVGVDVVTPAAGAPPAHRRFVLINLHGGAFMWGAGAGALVEAIPIAAIGGFEVVTVDYRLAPEHRFPAASQDVVAVYRALLKTHAPSEIGIYGCSAGGALAAQSAAQIIRDGLPSPGALGTFCGSGLPLGGDSSYLAAVADGAPPPGAAAAPLPYMAGASLQDPVAAPGAFPAVLARFPPTLLVAGSRDFSLSSLTLMQRRLLGAGVDARLVVFDGLWHAFFVYPDLPESREFYRLVSDFFGRELH